MDIVGKLEMQRFIQAVYTLSAGAKQVTLIAQNVLFFKSRRKVFYIVFCILSLKRIIFLLNSSIPVGKSFLVEKRSNIQSFTGVFSTHMATTVGTNSVIITFFLLTNREDAVVAVANLWPWASFLQRTDAGKTPQRLIERCNSSALTSARERCIPSDSGFASKC